MLAKRKIARHPTRIVLKASSTRLHDLVVPSLLGLGSAIFEGAAVTLLIPLLDLVTKGSFSQTAQANLSKFHLTQLLSWPTAYQFAALLITIFTVSALRITFEYLAQVGYFRCARQFGHSLRCELFSHIIGYGKHFFDLHGTATLQNTTIGFTNELTHYVNKLLSELKWLFLLMAYVVVMLFISWRLTIAALFLFLLYHYLLTYLLKSIERGSEKSTVLSAEVSRAFSKALSCITLVKVSAWEDVARKEFSKASKDSSDLAFEIDKKGALASPLQDFLMLSIALVLVSFAAFLASQHPAHNTSGFLVFVYLLKRSSTAMNVLSNGRTIIASVHGILNEISQLLTTTEEKYVVPSGEKEFSALQHSISFSHLTFGYLEEQPVLHDVSFSIEKGSVTALVGPSGSGKSSLVALLLRLYDCPPNSIFIDGTDIRDFNTESLCRRVAFVSQSTELFDDTLRNNLIYGLSTPPTTEELETAISIVRLRHFFQGLPQGFETLLGDRGVLLSGGEKQRIAIARAILRKPDLLILDEATSSLDSTTEKLLQAALDEIAATMTVVLIAHRFATLRNVSKIVTIYDGRVREVGSLEELLCHGDLFAELWNNQALSR